MKKADSLFLALAATYLVIGMGLGIQMGAAQDFQLAPVHAHINLVGFASHAIFGMAYRLWPDMKVGWLAKAHIWLFIPAAPLFMIGIAVALTTHSEGLVIAMSMALFLATLSFCINMWRVYLRA